MGTSRGPQEASGANSAKPSSVSVTTDSLIRRLVPSSGPVVIWSSLCHNGAMSEIDAPTVTPAGGTAIAERPLEESIAQTPWVTIVWDDPVNLMSYVTHVFTTYFNFKKPKAEKLMMQVHQDGKAVVSSGTREAMERDVTAMHEFGLWATLDRTDS